MEKKSNKNVIISIVVILILAIIITVGIAKNMNNEDVLEENKIKETNQILEPNEGEDTPQGTIATPGEQQDDLGIESTKTE